MISLLGFGNLLVLVFLVTYRGFGHRSSALDWFMAARILQGVAWILIVARGQWADVLSVYGGNIALLFGVATENIAFATYRERSRTVERLFLGIAAVGTVAFLLFARTPALILAVGSSAGFVLELLITIIVFRRFRESRLLGVLGVLLGVLSISMLVRSVAGFTLGLNYTAVRSVLQSAFYLPVFALFLAGTPVLTLLLKEENEREVRESHEKYDVLFRSTPSAVFLSEADTGIILEANPQCLELTGYTAQELQGKTFSELGLWMPGERENAEATFRAAGRLLGYEMQARRRDGQERTWIVSSSPAHLQGRTLLASTIQDLTHRKALETRIGGLLAEKELLLREVHHRVRNNLNQIVSLLNLHAGRSGGAGTDDVFTDAANRVHGMLALYDQVYSNENYTSVTAPGYMKLLTDRLRAAFPMAERITVDLEIDDVELPPRTVAPVGQLVNELFTNSMKHAFQDRAKGSIRITLTEEGDELRLEYEDNGVGFDPAVVDATGGNTGGNFGTTLIQALAEQLNATWSRTGPPGT
ncbi:MAG: sensor histidine kinase, partial [Alkalispirochaeta sp.]